MIVNNNIPLRKLKKRKFSFLNILYKDIYLMLLCEDLKISIDKKKIKSDGNCKSLSKRLMREYFFLKKIIIIKIDT